MMRFFSRYHNASILMSVVLAVSLGVAVPTLFESIAWVGDLFIKLLKLFALPLICSALLSAMGHVDGGIGSLRALSKRLLSYMVISEVMAVTIALGLFNLFHPGSGGQSDLILQGETMPISNPGQIGWSKFILSVFPDNIFQALTQFELLPVVIFSIMFSIGCLCVGSVATPLIQCAQAVREVSSRCMQGIMKLAPFGIFSLVGSGVAQSHLSGTLKEGFTSLLGFVTVLMLGLFLHGLWQLLLVVLVTRQKVVHILRQSLSVFSTAFGTSSSVATLPVAMQAAERLKAKPLVIRLMLPLCASINVGGMMMYEMAAALFFTQMLGIDLSLSDQCLLALACILGGMAEGGIPETSMVSLVMVFRIVNIPLSAITLLLPLDRIIDRLRTVVNIFGNLCGVILVSHSSSAHEQGEEPAGIA